MPCPIPPTQRRVGPARSGRAGTWEHEDGFQQRQQPPPRERRPARPLTPDASLRRLLLAVVVYEQQRADRRGSTRDRASVRCSRWPAVSCRPGPLSCCAASSFFAIAIRPDDDDRMAKTAAVSEVRAWAKGQGFDLADRGRLPTEVWAAWERRATTTPPRESRSVTPTVSVEEFAAAQERLYRLERQVVELAARLAAIESRPADPRRRFPRSR